MLVARGSSSERAEGWTSSDALASSSGLTADAAPDGRLTLSSSRAALLLLTVLVRGPSTPPRTGLRFGGYAPCPFAADDLFFLNLPLLVVRPCLLYVFGEVWHRQKLAERNQACVGRPRGISAFHVCAYHEAFLALEMRKMRKKKHFLSNFQKQRKGILVGHKVALLPPPLTNSHAELLGNRESAKAKRCFYGTLSTGTFQMHFFVVCAPLVLDKTERKNRPGGCLILSLITPL